MIAITSSKFRSMRKKMGRSQKLIAGWFGVSDQSVARWEKGKTSIPGSAKVLIWLLYDQEVNGNPNAVRDYVRQTIGRDL